MSSSPIDSAKEALRLVNDIEDIKKENGLKLLDHLLIAKDKQITSLGYDQVIFKELLKLVQFESGHILALSLELIENHYYNEEKLWDEIAETLIHRAARSTDRDICQVCLEKISTLIDKFDESIAKHSKQLLKLTDLTSDTELTPILSEILTKLRDKVPKRRDMK